MTTKEAIQLFLTLDPTGERVLILSIDPEGNAYHPAADAWVGAYSARQGRAGLESLTAASRRAGYGPDDVVKGTPALFLMPGESE